MLTPAPNLRARRGVSLVELLVTMTVGGIALTLVAAICLRQQRTFADLAQASALSGQLRDAAAILPIDLRSISSVSGDIRDARDTSLEIRATIASAVVCDTVSGGIVLSPPGQGAHTYAALPGAVEVGDTVWRLSILAATEEWIPHRVAAVHSAASGLCHALGPKLGAERAERRVAIALDSVPSNTWLGMPLRVTRPVRYSLYRSSGTWSLGARDWNSASARFNTIQPLAGPFLSAAARGLRFEYFDSSGIALPPPVVDARAVALIHVDLRGQTKSAPGVVATAAAAGARIDSLSVWVALRNRR